MTTPEKRKDLISQVLALLDEHNGQPDARERILHEIIEGKKDDLLVEYIRQLIIEFLLTNRNRLDNEAINSILQQATTTPTQRSTRGV